MKTILSLALAAAALGQAGQTHAAAAPPLTPQAAIVVPGGPGGFDWMLVDPATQRLYATHPDAKKLTVLDLKTHAVQQVDTGDVSGVAVDAADGKVFVGGADQKIIVLDNATLAKVGEIAVSGPIDDIVLDPKTDTIYADHDDGTEVWTVDAKTNTLTGSVAVAGAPEYVAYDAKTDRLYQNIKPADCVQVIDPAVNKVTSRWSTQPATGPHGLAIDTEAGRLYTAGKNGKLAVLDLKSGKLIGSADIAKGTDQIAFDAKNKRVYCASGDGFLSVVQPTAGGAQTLANIPTPKEAHTLAVDPATGAVWISYTDDKNSYLQQYLPAK